MSCRCQDCGKQYKVDLNIPDELWKKITKKENLLCGSCIMIRIEKINDYDYWFLVKYSEKLKQEL